MTRSTGNVARRLKTLANQGFGAGMAIALGCAAPLIGSSQPAAAAERIVFTFGPFGQSFAIDDLQQFSETGTAPSAWRFYFNVTNAEPETVQAILTEEFQVSLSFLDETLNTIPGEFALFKLGQIFHTKSRRANIQALRSALVLSAADDGQISLIEFLQNYPVQQLYVDGVEIARVARDVAPVVRETQEVIQQLEIYWAVVKEFLAGFVCECETPPESLGVD